jgi:hypothetical protein
MRAMSPAARPETSPSFDQAQLVAPRSMTKTKMPVTDT